LQLHALILTGDGPTLLPLELLVMHEDTCWARVQKTVRSKLLYAQCNCKQVAGTFFCKKHAVAEQRTFGNWGVQMAGAASAEPASATPSPKPAIAEPVKHGSHEPRADGHTTQEPRDHMHITPGTPGARAVQEACPDDVHLLTSKAQDLMLALAKFPKGKQAELLTYAKSKLKDA
jgi:hypothetical protein